MYDRIKNIPSSRDGKMAFGIFAALIARASLNSGIELYATNADGSLFAFLMTGVLLYTIGLAIVRFDTNRPLFESIKRD